MKVHPLPDGRPSEHLGIGHMLKHYVAPAECWLDLADDFPDSVPDAAHPAEVRSRLPDVEPPTWRAAPGELPEPLREHWEQLRVPYRQGYLAVIQHFAEHTASPDEAPEEWVQSGSQGLPTTQLGTSGILLRVRRSRRGWQLYSAFRPAGFAYFERHCPQMDPKSVSLRRQVAAIRASTLLDRWRTDGEPS
jgi:hypothetical protein